MAKGSSVKEVEETSLGRVSVDLVIKKAVSEAFESWRSMVERKPDQINKIIREAVQAGMEAGYHQAVRQPADAYKATEKRLYSIPDLKAKVAEETRRLGDIKKRGLGRRSTDMARFLKAGRRISEDEILEALIQDKLAAIMHDKNEINLIEAALDGLKNEQYYESIPLRYFEGKNDKEIGVILNCDESTARRNRSRLVRRMSVRLYGAIAVG